MQNMTSIVLACNASIRSNQAKRVKKLIWNIDDLECISRFATNWFWAIEMAPRNTIPRNIRYIYTSKYISQSILMGTFAFAHQYETDRSFIRALALYVVFFSDSILINLCILCALCSLEALGWLWVYLFFAIDYGMYNIAFSFLSTAHSAMTSPRAKYTLLSYITLSSMRWWNVHRKRNSWDFSWIRTPIIGWEICFTKPRQPHTMRMSYPYEKKQDDGTLQCTHTHTP